MVGEEDGEERGKDGEEEEGEGEEGDIGDVSDEITLLAASSYLRKRGKLPWLDKEERSRQMEEWMGGKTGGKFWHDTIDLRREEGGGGEEEGGEGEEEGRGGGSNTPLPSASASAQPKEMDDESVLSGNNELTNRMEWRGGRTYFGPPDPMSYSSRPKSKMSEKFGDEEWKRMWYEKRWGKGYESKRKEKRIVKKVADLSMDVLSSSELVSMSDEEIMEAVRVYVNANMKRAEKQLRRGGKGQQGEGQQSERKREGERMTEKHGIKRSGARKPGNAKKAYETRIINMKNKEKQKPRGRPPKLPNVDKVVEEASKKKVVWRIEGRSISAKAAKIRVEQALEEGGEILSRDIKQILVAQRLKGRKELLLKVAMEEMGMKGKCVEVEGKMEFITNASVQVLGEVILENLGGEGGD